MLTVLLNWTYIVITTYITGNACLRLLNRLFRGKDAQRKESPFYDLFAGIMCTTCYAQVYSLFGGVGVMANLLLLGFCVVYAAVFGRKMFAELAAWRTLQQKVGLQKADEKVQGKFAARIDKCIPVLLPVLTGLSLIVYALCSSGAPKLIDTDWYHAQTIRWIEEYGCVTGVANLFYSLGFNSAQHYFDALYSMKDLLGQSMHATGGYFGWLML
ncbi:MAG: hypothetical protein IJ409_09020, partial [Lachnospiraceae bacterium]|nr:hypothetical protein [Lachnospiraceae bacterium]